jgi:fatty acid desaturase
MQQKKRELVVALLAAATLMLVIVAVKILFPKSAANYLLVGLSGVWVTFIIAVWRLRRNSGSKES